MTDLATDPLGLLADPSLCRDCQACTLYHAGECNLGLARLRVIKDMARYEFDIVVCRHCEDPDCVAACPNESIRWDDEHRVVIIDQDECLLCGACAEACPYHAIFYDAVSCQYLKCDLCAGREGGPVWHGGVRIARPEALLKEVSDAGTFQVSPYIGTLINTGDQALRPICSQACTFNCFVSRFGKTVDSRLVPGQCIGGAIWMSDGLMRLTHYEGGGVEVPAAQAPSYLSPAEYFVSVAIGVNGGAGPVRQIDVEGRSLLQADNGKDVIAKARGHSHGWSDAAMIGEVMW